MREPRTRLGHVFHARRYRNAYCRLHPGPADAHVLTRHDWLVALEHLGLMLLIGAILGMIGWWFGEHGFVLTYWWS